MHQLSTALFAEVTAHPEETGLWLWHGTRVDATIIAAPSATKHKARQRAPEMHRTRNGKPWFLGMTAHIGVDLESGLVHRLTGTAAKRTSCYTEIEAKLIPGEEVFSKIRSKHGR